MPDNSFLDDIVFDAELEGFLSGTSAPGAPGAATVNLAGQPATMGRPAEETKPLNSSTFGSAPPQQSATDNTAGIRAALAEAAASMMAGRFSSQLGSVGSVIDGVAKAAVPSSLEPVRQQATTFLSKAQPWKDFAWPLSVPQASSGCSRLTANIYNFQTNYAILFVLQLVMALVAQPSALITIVLTVVIWMLFLKKNDDPTWTPSLGGMQLGPVQRLLLLSAVTVIVLLFMAGGVIFNATLLYMLFVIVHGVIHDPSAMLLPGPAVPI